MKVELSNYTIKSCKNDPDHGNIKNWVIEISDDGNSWIQIDEHSHYSELNGPLITKSFKVSTKQFSRYIRFRHNGEYYGFFNRWHLGLKSIEFYGALYEP